jgi:hypothetical protein
MSNPEPNNPESKKGCGCCLAKGCLVLAVVAAIIIGVAVFGYRSAADKFRQFTANSAAAIPVETVSQEEYDMLAKRLDAFKKSAPRSGVELTLSAHDLNVLVAMNPDWSLVRGKVHVRIEEGAVKLNGSIPLSMLPKLRDQYLNGTLTFTPTMDDKVFHVVITGIKLKDYDFPKESMKEASASMEPQLTNRLLGDPVIGSVLIKAGQLKAEGDAFVLTRAAD